MSGERLQDHWSSGKWTLRQINVKIKLQNRGSLNQMPIKCKEPSLDISCLTRDRFDHTLKYKRLFNGDVSKLKSNLLYMYIHFSC